MLVAFNVRNCSFSLAYFVYAPPITEKQRMHYLISIITCLHSQVSICLGKKNEEKIREKRLEWIKTIFRSGLRNSTAPLHVSN